MQWLPMPPPPSPTPHSFLKPLSRGPALLHHQRIVVIGWASSNTTYVTSPLLSCHCYLWHTQGHTSRRKKKYSLFLSLTAPTLSEFTLRLHHVHWSASQSHRPPVGLLTASVQPCYDEWQLCTIHQVCPNAERCACGLILKIVGMNLGFFERRVRAKEDHDRHVDPRH